ncbi:carbon-nitrogen hydrolase family protein [Pleomorphovibrio marinus]|uniref:carbon-nitrogen hydrolase family protein n=1 Tax=Pleomorphovibrio marinus TaxID=2164132 RepID=UPI000E0BC0F1|nr:carbon-nitrogen hydrolase family protein [Pleomorphovibrio marinus]
MQIALAQLQSTSHNLEANMGKHKAYIKKAALLGVQLLVFPELSLTNYEPKLAHTLAMEKGDERIKEFQTLSDFLNIHFAIGLPIQSEHGIQICLGIFSPNVSTVFYAKRKLHQDEFPYFVPGHSPFQLNFDDTLVSFGICYETMFEDKVEEAALAGSSIYLASVSKSQKGVEDAYRQYGKFCSKHRICMGMVNSIGASDNFVAAGGTAWWNTNGERLNAMPDDKEGILLYNTNNHTCTPLIF